MNKKHLKITALTALFTFLSACGGGGNGSATTTGTLSSIAASRVIAPGSECPNGGIEVDSGIDTNKNGLLDADEVDISEVVCNGLNGSNGLNSLIATSVEASGNNCEFGGTRIEAGIDNNGNSVLDTSEVTNTEFLCALSSSTFDGLVYMADANSDGMTELFRTSKDSSSVTKLAGPKLINGDVTRFQMSPDRKHVAFLGDLDTDEVFELYVVSLLDGTAPIKVSGAMVAGGDVLSVFNDIKWSPDSSRIAYRADQDTDEVFELYTVFADGTGNSKVSAPLVAGGDVDVFGGERFLWSPDSSRIAYLADQDTDNAVELYSVFADGSNNVKVSGNLATNGGVDNFKWSPDSSRIAYKADQDTFFRRELYTATPEGTARVKVSGNMPTSSGLNGGQVNTYKWSPDSSRIAYIADQDSAFVSELYSVFPDGTSNSKVSASLVVDGDVSFSFEWSPDSSRIAYMADQDTDEVRELYSVFADGSGNRKISATLVAGGNVPHSSASFRWSPDSSQIAYLADQDTDEVRELYSVFADGSGNSKVSAILVADGDVSFSFQWSPDSSQIAYRADQEIDGVFELYTVFGNGSTNTKVSGLLAASGDTASFQWSPDSSRIAYRADQDIDDVFELYTVFADGTSNGKVSGLLIIDGDVSSFSFSW